MSKIDLFFIFIIVIFNLNYVKLSEIHFYHKSDMKTVAYKADFYELSIGADVDNKMKAAIVVSEPETGCDPIKSKPEDQNLNYFVLIKRNNKCGLEEKVKNAIAGGYKGALFYNSLDLDESNQKLKLNKSIKTQRGKMEIPLILIESEAAKEIKALYTYDKDHIAYFITDNSATSPKYNIMLFAVVVFILILVAIFFTFCKKK